MSKSKIAGSIAICLLALVLPAFASAQKNLPVLSSISPITTVAGTPVTITATGANFTSGCLILFNGVSLSTTYVSTAQLRATLTGAQVSTVGTAKVSVYASGRFGGTSASLSFTITAPTTTVTTPPPPPPPAPLAITTTSVPGGTTGTAYSASLGASGGTSPYTWSVGGGALPPGLTMSSAGAITGNPTTSGSYSFTAALKDAASSMLSYSYSINVAQGALPVSVTTATVPPGAAGAAYPATGLAASGGNGGPYNWKLSSGSLPPGLTLSSTGGLSGTPTTAASYSFSVQATDALGNAATHAYGLTVAAATTTTYLTTSFEDGTITPFYADTSSGAIPCSVTTAFAHSGTHSVVCENTSYTTVRLYYKFTSPANPTINGWLHESYWVMLGAGTIANLNSTNSGFKLDIARPSSGANPPSWIFMTKPSNTNFWYICDDTTTGTHKAVLTPVAVNDSQWYHFDTYYLRTGGQGTVDVYIDGALYYSDTWSGYGWDDPTLYNQGFWVGWSALQPLPISSPAYLYLDDITVDTNSPQ